MRNIVLKTVLGCLLLMPQLANAFYQNGILLNSIVMDFDFSEYDETREVLNERGMLFGGELEFGTALKNTPFWFSMRGQALAGKVKYDGETQGGLPHNTTTNELIYDWSLQFGRIYESWRSHDYATIYAGLGFHQWVRDIDTKFNPQANDNVIGLFERYTWFYANVGARGFLFKTARSHMMVEINLLRTIKPVMDVSFRGKHDATRIPLGEHYGARISLPFRYEITRKFQLYSEVFFEAWDLGRSEPVNLTTEGYVTVAGGLSEPRSTSRFKGVELGFFLRFE
ncbi:MAG: hypothetical protein OEX07_00685 [Gammaproteobacteria bacterium]|nr:hypothetical protein [Gammaproteobacteria bacterium]